MEIDNSQNSFSTGVLALTPALADHIDSSFLSFILLVDIPPLIYMWVSPDTYRPSSDPLAEMRWGKDHSL